MARLTKVFKPDTCSCTPYHLVSICSCFLYNLFNSSLVPVSTSKQENKDFVASIFLQCPQWYQKYSKKLDLSIQYNFWYIFEMVCHKFKSLPSRFNFDEIWTIHSEFDSEQSHLKYILEKFFILWNFVIFLSFYCIQGWGSF